MSFQPYKPYDLTPDLNGSPSTVLFVMSSGRIATPTVREVEPEIGPIESFLEKTANWLTWNATRDMFERRREEPLIEFLEPSLAMFSPEFLRCAQRMSSEEFQDLVKIIQRLVKRDFPNPFRYKGRKLIRKRVQLLDAAFAKFNLTIYAMWSPQADAIVFYAFGTGLQFLNWAEKYHPTNRTLKLACELQPSATMLLIIQITTFGERPDFIRKFGLV